MLGVVARHEFITENLERVSRAEKVDESGGLEEVFTDLGQLILTRRLEDPDVKGALGDLGDELRLDDAGKTRVLRRLAKHFASQWLVFDHPVREALGRRAKEQMREIGAIKRELLQTAVIEALAEADEPRQTRIGDDRAWGHGSELVLLQKKDVDELAEDGMTEELIDKLTARPAGLRVFTTEGILSPIEGAFRGVDPWEARPLDLRPSLLVKWVRVRAIKRAEERLKEDSPAVSSPSSRRRVWQEVPGATTGNEKGASREKVSELELLEALGLADPDPLEALIAEEQRERLLQHGTPVQREVEEAIIRQVRSGASEAEAVKAVAEEREVEVNTIHKTRQRFRDRVREQLSEEGVSG